MRIKRRGLVHPLFLALAALAFPLHMTAELPSSSEVPQTISGLGTTSFLTTVHSPEARTAFMRGLLLLHLFEYGPAAKSFVEAEKIEPSSPMPYWGEAMTFNHGVWNQVAVAAGKAALDKYAPTPAERSAKISDPRERAYMASVELLYDNTGTKVERDLRYAKAMQSLSVAFPSDRNAQLFYALALIGQSESVRDVPAYLHAAEISKAVFRLEPHNPGAAHYWIHGMDDPEHAAGALEAARALSKIAPDAPHAQHMCSHIFIALGMWDDVVQSNLDAMRVMNGQDQAQGFPSYDCGHYAEWLEYGYFQQGRVRKALQTVTDCKLTGVNSLAWMKAHPGLAPYGAKDSTKLSAHLQTAAIDMQNIALINVDVTAASSLEAIVPDPSVPGPDTEAWVAFTSGYAAAGRKDLSAARAALATMKRKTEAYRASTNPDPEDIQTLLVGHDELDGFIQAADNHLEAGLTVIKGACDTYHSMAFAFGPPATIKPPDELMGEILLHHGDAASARKAFEQSLRYAPLRTESLLGLAQAEQASGDKTAAQTTYKSLLAIWHSADSDLNDLAKARRAIAP